MPTLAAAATRLTRAGNLLQRAAVLRVDDPERGRMIAEVAELVAAACPPRCAAGCRVPCPEGVHDAEAR